MSGQFMKMCSLVLSVVMLVSSSGCSFLAGSRQQLSVTASEPDAEIFINGTRIGAGHIRTMVRRDQGVSVLITREGFQPVSRNIETKLSAIGMADVIAGSIILLPLLGLMAPGSRELQQPNVSIVLQKIK